MSSFHGGCTGPPIPDCEHAAPVAETEKTAKTPCYTIGRKASLTEANKKR